MSIRELYFMFTTWHMRLPYWLIAVIIIVFIVLLYRLFKLSVEKNDYNRLYEIADNCLKDSKNELLNITIKCKNKEKEINKLHKNNLDFVKKLKEKEVIVKDLKKEISVLQEKNKSLFNTCESEKSSFILNLQIKERNIDKLSTEITLIKEKYHKIEKEKKQLECQLKNTQKTLRQKIEQFSILEKKCSKIESKNKKIEDSRILQKQELDELKVTIKQQTNAFKTEIRNLNLKIGRRDEKIEKMNEASKITQKELEAVQDENNVIKNQLQNKKMKIKKSRITDNDLNIIEKFAKW